ncbi:hybrid sensor histidine kinase/response regulator [Pragia fontium]|uniref:histidine kinase n=1 Tax=Pragia fontium TaxID=82985 RepID=A0ABQ5LJ12_9GAMM|nr:transporter substrate-binding domain-containing protein [Pragia fontium]GKX62528.1 hybrid sensor histidine kinase/response regulator [Pragia fontium]
MLHRIVLLLLIFINSLVVLANDKPQGSTAAFSELSLLGRTQITLFDMELTPDEWAWLHKKRIMKVGVYAYNFPPYDITTEHRDFTGVSADYLGLIAWNLNVKPKIFYYLNYADMIADLNSGKIDLIINAGYDEKETYNLLLSRPYITNVPSIVVNLNPDRENREKVNVVLSPVYANVEAIRQYYPNANFITFNSDRRALEELSFKHVDIFIGEENSVQYLINQSNLNNLTMYPLLDFNLPGLSFAAINDNKKLINIINKTLSVIPENIRVDIQRRWNGGIPLSLSDSHPFVTSLERKWIDENKEVQVVIGEEIPPLYFFDAKGKLHGVVADILTAITIRTGLKFKVTKLQSSQKALEYARTGSNIVIGGITLDSALPNDLLATRSFFLNSRVLVGKKNRFSRQSVPKTIVIMDGYPLDNDLTDAYPGSRIMRASTLRIGLDWVKDEKVDMMVLPLISADFMLPRFYADSLEIIASLDRDPASFVLAVSPKNYPLVTILDKAILNIPPEDLHAVISNWYTNTNLFNTINEASAVSPSRFNLASSVLNGILIILLFIVIVYVYRQYHAIKREGNHIRQTLLDAIPLPVYIMDYQGGLTYVNERFLTELNLTKEQTIGQDFTLLPDGLDGMKSVPLSVNFQEPVFITKQVNLHDQLHTIHQWNQLFLSPSGDVWGYIGGWIDVTEREKLIIELKHAKEIADKASRAKSTFLATMSHEIRTPLGAIIGMLELLLRRKTNESADWDSIRIAHDSALSLLTLIGDILDISKIESDKFMLRPERANIRQLIESVAMMFEGVARQKELQFQLEIDADIIDNVLIDPMRFKQILSNLLSNAIKFTERGRIVLQAHLINSNHEQLELHIVIQDTGCGIDEQTQSRLFQPFVQGDERSYQGTGLGLYICRSLAQMMGGDITLSSQIGIGTEVSVILYLSRLANTGLVSQASEKSKLPVASLNILIAEDHPASRLLLMKQLQYLGHHVECAVNGHNALAMLKTHKVDLLITDCSMPEMDGYTLTRYIRQLEEKQKTKALTIWGLTANAQKTIHDSCLASGMNDCLFKPISLNALADKLSELSQEPEPTFSHFDPSELLIELSNVETRQQFIQLLTETLSQDIATLSAAQQSAQIDDELVRQTLHRIRGGLQLIGAKSLISQCQRLEQQEAPLTAARVSEVYNEIIILKQELECFLML